MYTVKINNEDPKHQSHEVKILGKELFLNDELFDWDIERVKENYYHILKDNKSYTLEVVELDVDKKTISLKINNTHLQMLVRSKLDLLLEKLGMSANNAAKLQELKAPMPGLILKIMVEEGQEVKKGDSIMILEAMKMENIIKSPGEGIVKSVEVKEGDSVEKNSLLVKF